MGGQDGISSSWWVRAIRFTAFPNITITLRGVSGMFAAEFNRMNERLSYLCR